MNKGVLFVFFCLFLTVGGVVYAASIKDEGVRLEAFQDERIRLANVAILSLSSENAEQHNNLYRLESDASGRIASLEQAAAREEYQTKGWCYGVWRPGIETWELKCKGD